MVEEWWLTVGIGSLLAALCQKGPSIKGGSLVAALCPNGPSIKGGSLVQW